MLMVAVKPSNFGLFVSEPLVKLGLSNPRFFLKPGLKKPQKIEFERLD